MKEKQTDQEKTIVIDIKLTKGLVVAVSCVLVIVGLLAYLTLTGERAVAAEAGTSGETALAQSAGMRQFYLTDARYYGNEALTACAAGYHMASLWEIADPSNLKYNTSLGRTEDDSGQGPLANWFGWVRTGYAASTSGTAGQGNCDAWSSDDVGHWGTRAILDTIWTSGQDIGVWSVDATPCHFEHRVWCIED